MGCYAPAPVATTAILNEIHTTALQPTIDGMRKDGIFYLWYKCVNYLRISFCGIVIYGVYVDLEWAESIGI